MSIEYNEQTKTLEISSDEAVKGFVEKSNSIEKSRLTYADLSTPQQLNRDERITELLGAYVENYKEKVEGIPNHRKWLVRGCVIVIIMLAGAILYFARWAYKVGVDFAGVHFATILTATVSLLTSILGILTIIVKFFFPENEDQSVIDIVKVTQENDLKNRQMMCDLQIKH